MLSERQHNDALVQIFLKQLEDVTFSAVMWQGSLTWEWTRSTIGDVGTSDMSDGGN